MYHWGLLLKKDRPQLLSKKKPKVTVLATKWRKGKHTVFGDEFANRNLLASTVLKLINWKAIFTFLKIPIPTDNKVILEKLIEEKLIIKRTEKYHITNLGALLFANNLNDFGELKRKAPRVIIYKGNNKIHTIKEQTGVYGYAVGYPGMIEYINDRLPSNEEIRRVFRNEIRVYPEIAISELVANSVIHQDLNISGANPMIEIFDNRIEITNPGKPLIDTERFIDQILLAGMKN